MVKFRCKKAKEEEKLRFYKEMRETQRFPRSFAAQLRKMQMPNNLSSLDHLAALHMEKSKTEVSKSSSLLKNNMDCLNQLSLFARIKFSNFCNVLINKTREATRSSLRNSLMDKMPDPNKLVMNLSSRKLTRLQREALAYGTKFCIPNKVNDLETKAEFESLYSQLYNLPFTNKEAHRWFKVKLVDICHQYKTSTDDKPGPLSKAHLSALKSLFKDRNRMVLNPDKGSGVVVMDRTDYVKKVKSILDLDQFQIDGGKDVTEKLEQTVSNTLNALKTKGIMTEMECEKLRPVGTQIARLYALPKIHKNGIPVRPILSMVNTPTHQLGKWLANLLKPVRDRFNKHCLKDTFEFVDKVRNLNVKNAWMCSLDVSSLFTQVPLKETIDFVCNHISENHKDFELPVADLQELLYLCCSNIQFMFDGRLYRQTNGLSMGSALAPVLADLFMMMLEQKHATLLSGLQAYFRYVDDTFVVCESMHACNNLLEQLNTWHPNIKFTIEHELEGSLSFLDVLMTRTTDGTLMRRVFHKKTWTGQYLHFNSYCPLRRKIVLVKTLYTRTERICSPEVLDSELDKVRKVLNKNGYPDYFIERHKPTHTVSRTDHITVNKKKVFINLQYKGEEIMKRIKNRLRSALAFVFYSAELVLVERTRTLPVPSAKDKLGMKSASMLIYQWTCVCNQEYLGRTIRRLGTRMVEHVPVWCQKGKQGNAVSSITKHILDTQHRDNPLERFKILIKARRPMLLPFLEAIAIKQLKPSLCAQKEFVKTLALPWGF